MQTVKRCIAEVASNFTTDRMMQDYEDRFYGKLHARHTELIANDFAQAREIAAWKRRGSRSWESIAVVEVTPNDVAHGTIKLGEEYDLSVVLDIDGLQPEDIGIEMVVVDQISDPKRVLLKNILPFEVAAVDGSRVTYRLQSMPENAGSYDVAIRAYARNPKLPHRMDFALVKWI